MFAFYFCISVSVLHRVGLSKESPALEFGKLVCMQRPQPQDCKRPCVHCTCIWLSKAGLCKTHGLSAANWRPDRR